MFGVVGVVRRLSYVVCATCSLVGDVGCCFLVFEVSCWCLFVVCCRLLFVFGVCLVLCCVLVVDVVCVLLLIGCEFVIVCWLWCVDRCLLFGV